MKSLFISDYQIKLYLSERTPNTQNSSKISKIWAPLPQKKIQHEKTDCKPSACSKMYIHEWLLKLQFICTQIMEGPNYNFIQIHADIQYRLFLSWKSNVNLFKFNCPLSAFSNWLRYHNFYWRTRLWLDSCFYLDDPCNKDMLEIAVRYGNQTLM